jgi:dTDP-4-dehydrorhamnose 3,5-epimerase
MKWMPTVLPEVLLITPTVFRDDRGFFLETYHASKYAPAGIPEVMVQDNHSGSRRGVLRGLHYQIQHPQGKLLSVLVGEIFDVAVDLRRSSPTFAKWVGLRLSAEARQQVWIPPGFAHGFYVLSEWAELAYKVSDLYSPEHDRTLLWNDETLNIDWPLIDGQPPLLSPKDTKGRRLAEADLYP